MLKGSRAVTVTRMSLHCQTCCQGRKRGSGGSLSSAACATDVLSTDSAATPARNSFFIWPNENFLIAAHTAPPSCAACTAITLSFAALWHWRKIGKFPLASGIGCLPLVSQFSRDLGVSRLGLILVRYILVRRNVGQIQCLAVAEIEDLLIAA